MDELYNKYFVNIENILFSICPEIKIILYIFVSGIMFHFGKNVASLLTFFNNEKWKSFESNILWILFSMIKPKDMNEINSYKDTQIHDMNEVNYDNGTNTINNEVMNKNTKVNGFFNMFTKKNNGINIDNNKNDDDNNDSYTTKSRWFSNSISDSKITIETRASQKKEINKKFPSFAQIKI